MTKKESKKEYKRNILFAVIAGFLPAFFTVIGYMAKNYHGFDNNVLFAIGFIPLWISFSALSFLCYNLASYRNTVKKNNNSSTISIDAKSKRIVDENIVFLISFAILIVVWMPSFMAFYPGIFAYDNQWQYTMYINNDISTHQPVFHTLILGFLITTVENMTGSINKGVAAYTIFQMVMMALGLSFIPYLLRRVGAKIASIIFSIAFFALFPIIVIFVFTGTKDSIFSVAVVDFVGFNLCLLSEKSETYFTKKKDAPIWVLLAFVILTFRGNALYALIPMLVLLAIYVLKNCKKKTGFIISTSILLVLFIAFNYPITNAIAKEKVSKAEMMSVPCQQLARIYHYHFDELSEEDIATYDDLFDSKKWYGYYVPEIADASKGSLRMDIYESKKSDYWKLWSKWLKAYPKEYVDSVLENTYGLFYMWPRYVLYSYGQEGYTVIHPMQPVEANSKIPRLFDLYTQFENGSIVQKNGFVSWLFAPATYLYLMIISVVYVLKNKKYKLMIPFVFLILLWATFLIGPAALVRYSLFLFMMTPLLPMAFKLSKVEHSLLNKTTK